VCASRISRTPNTPNERDGLIYIIPPYNSKAMECSSCGASQGIELAFTEKLASTLGVSYGGRIAILPGQSKAETFSTLVHELGHELLIHASRRTTKTVREAEAIAFVVGKAVGLQTGNARDGYIYPLRHSPICGPLVRRAGLTMVQLSPLLSFC
jgi:hypothetical protein